MPFMTKEIEADEKCLDRVIKNAKSMNLLIEICKRQNLCEIDPTNTTIFNRNRLLEKRSQSSIRVTLS
jgi:hypothetical protein